MSMDTHGDPDGNQQSTPHRSPLEWIAPYVDLVPPGCLPDFGLRLLVTTNLEGERVVRHQIVGMGSGADAMLVIGMLETLKHQVLNGATDTPVVVD